MEQKPKAPIGGFIILFVVIALIVSQFSDGSSTLGDNPTCSEWIAASADEQVAYVKEVEPVGDDVAEIAIRMISTFECGSSPSAEPIGGSSAVSEAITAARNVINVADGY